MRKMMIICLVAVMVAGFLVVLQLRKNKNEQPTQIFDTNDANVLKAIVPETVAKETTISDTNEQPTQPTVIAVGQRIDVPNVHGKVLAIRRYGERTEYTVLEDDGNTVGYGVIDESYVYDFTTDSNLPIELRERLSSMLKSLNTCDVNSYCADFDLQDQYDLLSGKASLSDLPDMLTDLSLRDLREKRAGFKSEQIKSFEEYRELVLAEARDHKSVFDPSKPKRCFRIRDYDEEFDGEVFVVKVKDDDPKGGSFRTEWAYFKGRWWHTLTFGGP